MDSTALHLKQLIQAAREELEEAANMSTGLVADVVTSANDYLLRALEVINSEGDIRELDFD